MYPTLKSYGLENLPFEQKLTHVDELWESIAADEAALQVPQSHLDELQRRLTESQNDTDPLQSWEDVKRELEN